MAEYTKEEIMVGRFRNNIRLNEMLKLPAPRVVIELQRRMIEKYKRKLVELGVDELEYKIFVFANHKRLLQEMVC